MPSLSRHDPGVTRTPATTRDWSDAAARAGALLAVAWLLVLPTFGLGRIDLAGDLGLVAYWTSEVGGTRGLPFLIAALLALVVSRPGLPAQARAREALVLALALAVAAGIGAWANEHLLKPWVGSPRPDLRELFDLGFLPEAPARFYEIGDKATRSARLAQRQTCRLRWRSCATSLRARWTLLKEYRSCSPRRWSARSPSPSVCTR